MDDVDDFECDDFDKTLKVIVVGNGNVGKTSMTTRYAKGRYTGNYKKTIGVDFMEKRLELRDIQETVNLMIWDTAGQEEFGALTSRYYKGASAVIYVFSTTDRASFDALPKWQRKVEEECGRISHVLVQNKIDLVDDAAMSRREVEDMADDLGVRLFRSCVQDNVNVHEVFEYICRQYLKRSANGSNGRDDACHAVADISMLSEAAAAATLKGSQPSPTYERRSRGGREISDQSDSGSTMSEGRQGSPPSPTGQRQRGWGTRDGERVSSSRFDRGDESKDRPRSKRHEDEDEKEGRRGGRSAGSRRDDRQRGWDCDDREDRDRPRGDAREDRDRDRPRDRDREFERSRDRDRDGDRVRDRDRGRGQGRSRDGDNDRDLDRGRDRDRPRERDDRNDRTDRGRDRERRRDEDRARDHPPSNERGPSRYGDEREAVDVEASRSSDRDRKKQKDQPRGEARRPQGTSDNDRPLKEAGLKAGSRSPSKEESVRESEADAGAIPASSSTADKDGSFPQDSRQNSLSIVGTDRATPKDKKRTGSPESERTLDVDLRKPVDKATLRAQLREGQDDSEEESAFGADDCGVMGNPSTIASESSRIQPSKRRTNGKKTNPLLRKMGKLVYG